MPNTVLVKLKQRHDQVVLRLSQRHEKARRLIQATALGSSLFLSQPNILQLAAGTPLEVQKNTLAQRSSETSSELKQQLTGLLPDIPGIIANPQAKTIADIIHRMYGVDIVQQLDGHQLNHSYGWIGYEQHLKRYPGDTLGEHAQFQFAGIAPGLGGWGYFAWSKSQLGQEEILREEYYVAVQTLYTEEWQTNTRELSKWYKYRKVMVINPQNGKAVIAVVGDAGPGRSTGKQFGGSPEVMEYLQLKDGKQRGKVLLWFVDGDAPIGPVEYHQSLVLRSLPS